MGKSIETARNGNPVSRRDFLRVGGLSAAAIVELLYGPGRKLVDSLVAAGVLGEGSVPQRAAELDRLLSYAATSGNMRQAAAVGRSWFLFNAAELWARRQHLTLTPLCIRHFVYGHGESLDVSEGFAAAAVRATDGRQPDARTVAGSLSSMITEATTLKRPNTGLHVQAEGVLSAAGGGKNPELSVTVGLIPDTDHEDLALSLNAFALHVRGSVRTAVPPDRARGDRDWTFDLHNPQVSVRDRYDWTNASFVNTDVWDGVPGVGNFAVAFMRRLGFHDPERVLERAFGHRAVTALNRNWEIDTMIQAGEMLTAAGFGHEFAVSGRPDVGDMLSIRIDESLL